MMSSKSKKVGCYVELFLLFPLVLSTSLPLSLVFLLPIDALDCHAVALLTACGQYVMDVCIVFYLTCFNLNGEVFSFPTSTQR